MAKSSKYYFKQLTELIAASSFVRAKAAHTSKKALGGKSYIQNDKQQQWADKVKNGLRERNKRSVWTIATRAYHGAHFATFPEDLIVPMIKAGCPEGGLVIDPFSGAGTTCMVAKKLGRNYIGIELNPAYITMAEKRIEQECGKLL